MENPILVILQVLAVLVLGLRRGSELNVAAFAHPTLSRQKPEVHISVRAAFARLFGRVMPFWMAGSTFAAMSSVLRCANSPSVGAA